jgi:hypothetical protein
MPGAQAKPRIAGAKVFSGPDDSHSRGKSPAWRKWSRPLARFASGNTPYTPLPPSAFHLGLRCLSSAKFGMPVHECFHTAPIDIPRPVAARLKMAADDEAIRRAIELPQVLRRHAGA